MKKINLINSKYSVMVDDEDFDYLSEIKWHHDIHTNKIYAKTIISGKKVYMHRLIMKANDTKTFVDHKDNNGLNNQKNNLRICTNQQNLFNRKTNVNNSLGTKGVCYSKKARKYQAFICHNKNRMYLGSFNSIKEASDVYKQKAKELFGEFAKAE